ncbi:MAG: DUF805 domain-containing protein [Acinetobacter sp.]|nr:MAG: DUF805 domain-containing protein [Acinetobacter sp.]
MKGQILDFSIQTNIGIISGEDGNRYNFVGQEWKDARPPSRGMTVDFDIDTMGSAVQVYLTQAQGLNQFAQNVEQQLHGVISNHDGKNEAEYNLVDWFIKCLKNYANFSGRARRKEYWFFVLGSMIVGFIVGFISGILGLGETPSLLLNLAIFVPSLAVAARRLHDTNRSGWWQLISLTIIGIIPLIIWLATETKPESNQWGNPAK